MKKLKFLLLCCLAVLFCFSLAACTDYPWTKHFYDYHVVWYCDDPFIEFVGDERVGKMSLDGVEYNIDVSSVSHETGFEIYKLDPDQEGVSEDDAIWEGTAELKDGQLVLTIEKDYISNYEGQTIILNQRSVEDDV